MTASGSPHACVSVDGARWRVQNMVKHDQGRGTVQHLAVSGCEVERRVVAAVEGVRPDALFQEEVDNGGVAPQGGQVEGRPAVCGVSAGYAGGEGKSKNVDMGLEWLALGYLLAVGWAWGSCSGLSKLLEPTTSAVARLA